MKYTYVKVVFENYGKYDELSKDYIYQNLDNSIQKGDLVVVPARDAYQVVKVVGFTNKKPDNITLVRPVVQKLDLEGFEARKEKQQKELELKEAIAERVEHVRYMKELDALAESDETLQALVQSLKELEK